MMKLFELRNNFHKMSLPDFKNELAKQKSLDELDYKHFLISAFKEKRSAFTQYLLALFPYHSSILDVEVNNQPLFLEICASGSVEEVETILTLNSDLMSLSRNGEALFSALQNRKKREDSTMGLEIIKMLILRQPGLLDSKLYKPLLWEAIEKEESEIATFLIEEGADCSFVSENGENLLHVLMRSYSKQNEKKVLEVRNMLLDRGVDQNKKNVNLKKPLDLCPELQRKMEQEQKQLKKKHKNPANHLPLTPNTNEDHNKTKGKSEEGWATNRNKNSEDKMGTGDDKVVYLKIQNKFDEIQIQKEANLIVQKFTNEKEKELKKKKLDKGKDKEGQFKNRVMTPDELKHYLQEDIKYETEIIEEENRKQRTFLNELVENIRKKIKNELGTDVQIFGSFATELCLPESDIDMVVIPSNGKESANSFRLLENIYYLLEGMKEEVQVAKFIKTASVPIIKIQCTGRYNNKKIDITYQDDNHNGLESVELIQQYLGIYPQLRALTFILKKFIYSARLFDPYSGGISSYGLILMIVAYLQNENRERKKNKQGKNQAAMIGEILIGFLRFYGFKSNYIGKKICVLHPDRAKVEMEAKYLDMPMDPIYHTVMDMDQIYTNDWQPRAKLVILDPLNEKNNIGRATHKIREIRIAFEMAYVCIHTNKTCRNKRACKSYRGIRENVHPGIRYEENRRPCCIINRMLQSANTILVS